MTLINRSTVNHIAIKDYGIRKNKIDDMIYKTLKSSLQTEWAAPVVFPAKNDGMIRLHVKIFHTFTDRDL